MYTQRNEETFILESCKDVTRKRLLDIGAWDAKTFSNSRALIEAGWGGVLIEPSPGPLRGLVKEYGIGQLGKSTGVGPGGHIIVLAAAVGIEPGVISLHVTDDAVSTSDDAHAEQWATRGGYIGQMFIHTITIAQILERFGAFDMVSIDTEGTSVDLLKVLLATEMFPRCIVCEHDQRLVEATGCAMARGYHVLTITEENIVLGL